MIVLGRCMRSHLEGNYGIRPEQIEVISNWADPDEIRPLSKETRFRSKHNIQGFVVLYSGNLGYSHGIRDIIEAARLVNQTHPDVTFVLVGAGAQKDEIASKIKELGMPAIRLFPPVDFDEYPDLLASADVCLVSLGEGTDGLAVPCKFYSYLASGRPVIGVLSEGSEVARVLGECECGIQVSPGSARKLADAVIEVRNSPDSALVMGENARRALEEKYTLQHISELYYRVFASAQPNQEEINP